MASECTIAWLWLLLQCRLLFAVHWCRLTYHLCCHRIVFEWFESYSVCGGFDVNERPYNFKTSIYLIINSRPHVPCYFCWNSYFFSCCYFRCRNSFSIRMIGVCVFVSGFSAFLFILMHFLLASALCTCTNAHITVQVNWLAICGFKQTLNDRD